MTDESSGPDTCDVLVAGGSFVGLTLALALSRASRGVLRVTVVDRTPPDVARAAANDGRASALSAASMHLLQSLGVWEEVAAHAQAFTEIDISDSRLDAVARPSLLHFDGALSEGEPAAYMLENHVLRTALIASAEEAESISFIAPESVEDFSVTSTGVAAQLGQGQTIQASLLVAADGRRSALRKKAGIKSIGWAYPQAGIVATLGIERPHGGRAVQHFLPQGPFAILPLRGDRVSLVWTEPRDRADEIVALDDTEFLREARKRMGGRYGALSVAGPRGTFPLDLHLARAFVADRVALVGDAAHGVHPLAGQGLNIGLRDVAALAEVVIESARLGLDIGSTPVLERYQRWRRFDSAFSGFAMDSLNRLFSNDSAPLRSIRSFGLGLVDRAPALKRFFVREAAGLTGNLPRLLKGQEI
ncbi:MAG: FAD-dependent monooxygenase [Hyphomicrobiaceae bacterium]|nr:FAD-dependent monooxygenase [Hyphomicrobiaceae bacterium]